MNPPVIIIGAGRSGTNALRDALCTLDAFDTWPCDEINYVWRHGNRSHPTDQFGPEHARPDVRAFIRKAFERQSAKHPNGTVVEKTCANSLRVGFVQAVVPDARFIHIVRDGRDVAASAMQRWTAELDLPYLIRKTRFVPPTDLPYYAFSYLETRLARLRSDDGRLSWWGPKFDGMDEYGADTPLIEIAARQWERSVTLACAQLEETDPSTFRTITYRSLIERPEVVLGELVDWLGQTNEEGEIADAARTIRSGSVGKWRTTLSDEQIASVAPIVEPALLRAGLPI